MKSISSPIHRCYSKLHRNSWMVHASGTLMRLTTCQIAGHACFVHSLGRSFGTHSLISPPIFDANCSLFSGYRLSSEQQQQRQHRNQRGYTKRTDNRSNIHTPEYHNMEHVLLSIVVVAGTTHTANVQTEATTMMMDRQTDGRTIECCWLLVVATAAPQCCHWFAVVIVVNVAHMVCTWNNM